MGLFGKNKNENEIKEAYLMTVSNDMELSLVEGILRYEGIPMVKRYLNYGDATSLYIGFSNSGIEVYVSSEDIERAKEAIQKSSLHDDEAAEGETDEEPQE
jgi:hypothetical protein